MKNLTAILLDEADVKDTSAVMTSLNDEANDAAMAAPIVVFRGEIVKNRFGSLAGATPAVAPGTIDVMGEAFAVVFDVGIVAGHHVFLQTCRISNASWEDCAAFATAAGGSLPAADEMAALRALGVSFAGPHWTADRANGDRALAFSFLSGLGGYSHTSNEFNGLVVRREPVAPAGDDVVAVADVSVVAQGMLDADLWPEDDELVAEIRMMFMMNWGLEPAQADARMARFGYAAAVAALEGGVA